jgi:uncharacterized protein DUF4232
MAIQRLVRPTLLLAGGALTLALTAAFQGNVNATGSWSDNGATSNVAAGGPADTPANATPAAAGGSARSGLAECKAGNLKLSLGAGDGAGAGSVYPAVQFTNVSKISCVLAGFPGISYVGGNDGHQVGAAATRTGGIGSQITLRPGAMAAAVVKEANTGNFDATDCQPVGVRGFRVYAPDDTTAMFLPFSGEKTACANTRDGQLSVETVKSGAGSTDATTDSAASGRCHTGDLTAHLGTPTTTPNGGFVSGRVDLIYTNTSGRTCTMDGFGGVDLQGPADPNGPVDSLRRGATGQLDPSDPRYVPTPTPTLVTLTPGASAHTLITFASNTPNGGNVGSNGSVSWTPTTLVATPPNETTSLTTPWLSGTNVFRDDSATVAMTYITPVQPGA